MTEEIILTDENNEEVPYSPPLADSSNVRPGLLVGVQVSSSVNAPFIDNGVLFLPEASASGGSITRVEYSSGVEEPQIVSNTIYHPLAQASNGSRVAGVITGLRTSGVLSPEIVNGEICIPLESIMKGVVDASGGHHQWESIAGPTTAVDVAHWTGFSLAVYTVNGYMAFSLHN